MRALIEGWHFYFEVEGRIYECGIGIETAIKQILGKRCPIDLEDTVLLVHR